mgnify:CR=1 FL=1
MYSLLKKEIQAFLGSLIGYIVIVVFITIMSLIMWVFPGDLNVMDSEYASLNPLFTMAPWIFMFLIPAVTMRLFADENRSGTIELLLTKPLTDLQIILSKYFAGLLLVLLFLASGFVAIGLFASSLSDNQVIAFILAVFMSFIAFIGFDFLSSLELFGAVDLLIMKLGINEHYASMSRGVIDS